ncbi:MAG: hypothetical protein KBD37_01140 [Burkholderiales bacterium]|nr:hypothetical protein [Burkholderiales bacterium]
MFHAYNIVQHLSSNRHHSGVNKILGIIEDLVAQFREKKLDVAVAILEKHVSETKVIRYTIIRSIVSGTILSKNDGVEFCVEDSINQAVSQFTQEEAASILSAIDVSLFIGSPKNLYNLIFWGVFSTISTTR